MGKRKISKIIDDIYDGCICANECTGLFQKASLDTLEIEQFRKQFNKKKR